MASNKILKRGFKAESERIAIQYREALGIQPRESLCAFKLADHLQIKIYSATEFISSPAEINLLSGSERGSEWSALTMSTLKGNRIIIHNPFNSITRQQSDLMHELAHIICNHKHSQVEYSHSIPFGMREFNKEQEEEAKCLGSTLQITRQGLYWAKKRNMKIEDIAKYYNASVEMVKYRLNMSGVERQISYLNK